VLFKYYLSVPSCSSYAVLLPNYLPQIPPDRVKPTSFFHTFVDLGGGVRGNKMPTRRNRWFFIAKIFIVCSTCFGHYYAHHQELKSNIKWLLPVVFGALVFKLSVWCGAVGCVSGLRDAVCPSSGAQKYYTDGCCLWYFVLWFWFSSCRSDVELDAAASCKPDTQLTAPHQTDSLKTKAPSTTGSSRLYNTLELLMMGIQHPTNRTHNSQLHTRPTT